MGHPVNQLQIAETLHIFLSDLVGDLRRVAEAGDVVGLDGDEGALSVNRPQ